MARRKTNGTRRRATLKGLSLAAEVMLLALGAVLAFNTARLEAEPLAAAAPPPPAVDSAAVGRLAQALRIPTISSEAGAPSQESLSALAAHLESSFPRAHAQLVRELVGGGSLLYTWRGTDPHGPALLLAAHQDVVPVEASSEPLWTHPPFAGVVADGFVWGRGAIDDKASLMAIMEAVERQLERGFRPRQTIYLAFGHDEEIGGENGARSIAELLRRRGARIGLVLDEGLAVLEGIVAGVTVPVAMIGTAQKGYVSVGLTATGPGGHSSMPSSDNAATSLARAVQNIADEPFPTRLDGPAAEMLDAVAPYARLPMRIVLANRWLTGPLVERQLLRNAGTAALLRTTTAPTILRAGTKDNVLPQHARAVINHRILPGESVASVLAHDRRAIDDPAVQVQPLPGAHNPSRRASLDSAGYRRARQAIRATYPHAAIAPGLVLAATDARHYEPVAETVLRFLPLTVRNEDVERIHGNDERIGIAEYMRAIAFYERLITAPAT